jgi:hypothetical protein
LLPPLTATLDLALKASGCDQAKVVHKPRLLSDNGSSFTVTARADPRPKLGEKQSKSAARSAFRSKLAVVEAWP